MAVNLERSIQRIYDGHFSYGYHRSEEAQNSRLLKFLTIPLKEKNIIEIPTMAINKIQNEEFQNTDYDSIVIPLFSLENTTSLVSIEPMFKEVFCSSVGSSGLIRMVVKKGTSDFFYYGCGGALFDVDFNPIIIASWLFERIDDMLTIRKPILRISPICFRKRNPLESFIVGKLLTKTLDMTVSPSYSMRNVFNARTSRVGYSDIRVIIEPIPYLIQPPRTPDINTTTQSLLNLLIDNQDEIVWE